MRKNKLLDVRLNIFDNSITAVTTRGTFTKKIEPFDKLINVFHKIDNFRMTRLHSNFFNH